MGLSSITRMIQSPSIRVSLFESVFRSDRARYEFEHASGVWRGRGHKQCSCRGKGAAGLHDHVTAGSLAACFLYGRVRWRIQLTVPLAQIAVEIYVAATV